MAAVDRAHSLTALSVVGCGSGGVEPRFEEWGVVDYYRERDAETATSQMNLINYLD